jgi:hypothetical protein
MSLVLARAHSSNETQDQLSNLGKRTVRGSLHRIG